MHARTRLCHPRSAEKSKPRIAQQAQNLGCKAQGATPATQCSTRGSSAGRRRRGACPRPPRPSPTPVPVPPSPTPRRVLPASTRVPVAVPQPEDTLPGGGIVRRVSSRQGSRRCAKPLGEGARRVPWPRWLHVASSLLCSHAPGINWAPVSPTWLLAGCRAPLRRRQPREAWRAAGAGAVAGAGLWLHAGHRAGRSAQRARLSALGDAEAQLRVTVEGAQGPARRAG